MITTVVTTITTVAALGTTGVTALIGIATLVCLIALLTIKEVAGATHSASQLRVARFMTVGIVPLAVIFAAIVLVKIVEIIG